jgi:hypothetical protein
LFKIKSVFAWQQFSTNKFIDPSKRIPSIICLKIRTQTQEHNYQTAGRSIFTKKIIIPEAE